VANLPDTSSTGATGAYNLPSYVLTQCGKNLVRVVLYFHTVTSTNLVCRRLGAHGLKGVLAVADVQTHGRGRHGKTWHCPPGLGLLFSLSIHTDGQISTLYRLAQSAPVAAAEGIQDACGVEVGIKWPNDLFTGGKKVGGLLIEASGSCAVLGVGINTGQATEDFEEDIRESATSLMQELSAAPERGPLLVGIVRRLEHRLSQVETDFTAVMEARRTLEVTTGRRLFVKGPEGDLEGTGAGLSDKGDLLIRLDTGQTVSLSWGEATARMTEER
jgi:BirA family transcriptional regulator, biotin operon repressor / biotin---[acetyl-CoA-carboxylase] ligase